MSTVQRPYWEDRAKRAERELATARVEIEMLRKELDETKADAKVVVANLIRAEKHIFELERETTKSADPLAVDNPSAEVLEERHRIARRPAHWSSPVPEQGKSSEYIPPTDDEEINLILGMTHDQICAVLKANGEDPEEAGERVRRIINDAMRCAQRHMDDSDDCDSGVYGLPERCVLSDCGGVLNVTCIECGSSYGPAHDLDESEKSND